MKKLFIIACLATACSTKNMADPYTNDTPDEKAKAALDDGRFDDSIAIYKELIAADPEGYQRYPLLSAAYAGKAGVDIINIVKEQFGGSAGGSVFELIGSFVPNDPDADQLAAIQDSVAILQAMPEEHRVDGSYAYSTGAAFQLSLYLAASSAMVLNQFATPQGEFTPESLESMSEEDVDAVLENLDAIIASQASGAAQEALQGKVGETLAAIQAQPGDSLKEQLANYLGH